MSLSESGFFSDVEYFCQSVRDKKTRLMPGVGRVVCDILSGDDVRQFVFESGARYPDLQVVLEGPVDHGDYTFPSGLVDVVALAQLIHDGHSVVLHQLHNRSGPLASLVREFEATFECRAQANVYFSPPNAAALPPHFDNHDVFIFQVEGTKTWQMMKGSIQLPGPETTFLPQQHEPGELEESFQVSAGDVLYVPRGIMHHAVASESDAVHITIGVFWITYADVAVDLLKHLVGRQAELRASIPRDWRTSTAIQQQVLAEIHKHVDAISLEEIRLVLTERWLDLVMTRQPLISDQLEQLRQRDEIKPSTQFRVRPLALWHQSVHDDQAVVYCYGREIAFPSHIGPLLETLFRADGIVTINALLKEIESPDWKVVVQRLLAEGLLELV